MSKIKNKGGRPEVVLTDKQIKEVEKLSASLTCEQIADYLGIDADTFLAIRKRQPEVFRCYKKGRTKKILKYVNHLDEKIFNVNAPGDTTALIFALKAFGSWSDKQQLDITTKDMTPKLPDTIIKKRNKNESTGI
jgi:hypothetical protein